MCDPFQQNQSVLKCFQLSHKPEKTVFSNCIMVVIMYFDGSPAFLVVGSQTHFPAVRYFPTVSTKHMWKTLLAFWHLIYVSFPNRKMVY